MNQLRFPQSLDHQDHTDPLTVVSEELEVLIKKIEECLTSYPQSSKEDLLLDLFKFTVISGKWYRIPEKPQKVILLHIVQGKPLTGISQILDLPLSQVEDTYRAGISYVIGHAVTKFPALSDVLFLEEEAQQLSDQPEETQPPTPTHIEVPAAVSTSQPKKRGRNKKKQKQPENKVTQETLDVTKEEVSE